MAAADAAHDDRSGLIRPGATPDMRITTGAQRRTARSLPDGSCNDRDAGYTRESACPATREFQKNLRGDGKGIWRGAADIDRYRAVRGGDSRVMAQAPEHAVHLQVRLADVILLRPGGEFRLIRPADAVTNDDVGMAQHAIQHQAAKQLARAGIAQQLI